MFAWNKIQDSIRSKRLDYMYPYAWNRLNLKQSTEYVTEANDFVAPVKEMNVILVLMICGTTGLSLHLFLTGVYTF